MDFTGEIKQAVEGKYIAAINRGEVFFANEIKANYQVGNVMSIITALILACFALNEVEVFTADKEAMRIAALISVMIALPVLTANQRYNGEFRWLKQVLVIDLTVMCALLSALLGHNVTLTMVIPVVLSTRYYDEKFTKIISLLTIVLFTIAEVICAFFGIMNLNMVKIARGTALSISSNLRNAIRITGFEVGPYLKSLMLNDFAPKLVIFMVVAITCVLIARRGREIILVQSEISRKSERVNTELELATQIQIGMLPCIFPAFPTHGFLDIFAKNIPAKEVGGDFYDYFVIDEDHVALVMADVSGKGVGAALFMTISKIVIKNNLQSGLSPAEALTKSNAQLCENNSAGLFVTAWAGVYEVSTGKLTFVNAGHNPPIICRNKGKHEYLEQRNGIVLAGMDGFEYTQSTVTIEPNDAIFLYTDGVTEATNINNELYGEQRLLDFLNGCEINSAEEVIGLLIDDVMEFTGEAEQFDDITMLGMRVLEEAE